MLRKHLIFVLLVCVFGFAGCGVMYNMLSESGQLEKETLTPYVIARNTRDCLLQYVETSDIDGICSLYSETVSISSNEVRDTLNTIQGEIVATETDGIVGGVKISQNGVYTLYTYTANIIVFTDNDNEYKVTISGSAVNVEHPEEVGIERFTVVDCKTGEYSNAGRWFTDNKR